MLFYLLPKWSSSKQKNLSATSYCCGVSQGHRRYSCDATQRFRSVPTCFSLIEILVRRWTNSAIIFFLSTTMNKIILTLGKFNFYSGMLKREKKNSSFFLYFFSLSALDYVYFRGPRNAVFQPCGSFFLCFNEKFRILRNLSYQDKQMKFLYSVFYEKLLAERVVTCVN